MKIYPKDQFYHLKVSEFEVVKTRLFKALSNQFSAKQSCFLRFASSRLGYSFLKSYTHDSLPTLQSNLFFIQVKGSQEILFELLSENQINVWRNIDGMWFQEKFLGYGIVESYSFKEIQGKIIKIQNTLTHLLELNKVDSSNYHGDLTHHNILILNEEVAVIDRKQCKNYGYLFDTIHFVHYLSQCIYVNTQLSNSVKIKIYHQLSVLFNEVVKSEDGIELKKQMNSFYNLKHGGIQEGLKEKLRELLFKKSNKLI